MDELLTQLNPEQRTAVTTTEGPLLIIAGAGSGKTRVITFRIAYMLSRGIDPKEILALTFTNKAANEMKQRVKELAGPQAKELTVSTFHAFGLSILRRYFRAVGLRDNFTIYDAADQIALLKETAREEGISPEELQLSELIGIFSKIKSRRTSLSTFSEEYQRLYRSYQSHLRLYNAVDFDDLIVEPAQLLQENEKAREHYQERFKYIMVDEFQDTSSNQYTFLQGLTGNRRNVCVVGDDDQSIYSWRGANYTNLVNFERDYPERLEVKLEQNYRSTGTILQAANRLIANNTNRKGKELWTGIDGGHPIELYYAEDDSDEAKFIAEQIKTLALREGIPYSDVGVLVRTNTLSRLLEEHFLGENIPYHISGGQSFFQRREIKDLIAYLRVFQNPDDDISLLRVLNTPRRGIGRRTLEQITAIGEQRHCSLYSALSLIAHGEAGGVSAAVQQDLNGFVELVEQYQELLEKKYQIHKALEKLIHQVDYWAYLVMEHQKNDKIAKWKWRNLNLFIDIAKSYEIDPDNVNPTLSGFLNRITLQGRDEVSEEADEENRVHLMTIHAAKGLEHEVVFLAAVEDGIIPHARSVEEDPENLEEERRLFYVAITRARQKLIMSSARKRRIMRELVEMSPSPFLREIPEELISVRDFDAVVDKEEGSSYFAQLKETLRAKEQL
ncbi:MAG: ATP-dependent helicase [Spirochaetaceae bacterium]